MKTLFYPLLLSFIVLTSGCGNRNRQNDRMAENRDEPPVYYTAVSDKTEVPQNKELDTLYHKMTLVALPYIPGGKSLHRQTEYTELPRELYPLFYNSELFDAQTRVAKLPAAGDFLPVMVCYRDIHKKPVTDLYVITPDGKLNGRLQVISTEKIEGKKGDGCSIIRHFERLSDSGL